MFAAREAFRRVCRARDLLVDPITDRVAPRTVREIARSVGLSPFYLIRLFGAVFGATPHQYRIQARIDRAKRLLAEGDAPVTAVCMEVGCASLGSFSDMFARRVGASPSGYRRRIRRLASRAPEPAPVPGCLGLMTALPSGALGAQGNSREAPAVRTTR